MLAWSAPNPEGIQVYRKNFHLYEEHKQKVAADIYQYYKAENIWDVLRREFILPHYEYMPQVQAQINWLLLHQDFLITSANRAAPFLHYILQQVHKRHLPPEFVLLPIMESSYNPFACSNKGATGIWQMMPGTATGFGIKQNFWYDGRRDVIASTRAALDYISYLGSYFGGNWLLAIAAYDTGEGNVLSAIKRNMRQGLSADYWLLPLSQETKDYVPRLMALAIIVSYPDRYPILLPPIRNAPYLAQIDVGGQIELHHAATLAGLSLKRLIQLNPGYNRSSTDPNGRYKLIVPIEHAQRLSENLEHIPFSHSGRWHRYKVKLSKAAKHLTNKLVSNKKNEEVFIVHNKNPQPSEEINTIANTLANLEGKYSLQPGDTLYMIRDGDDLNKIAKRFHIDTWSLLAVNQMNDPNKLVPGEKMIIPTHLAQANSIQTIAQTSGETIYSVKRGDSIETIADQFQTTPDAIRVANLLSSNQLQIGDKLVIPQVG